MPAMYQHKLKLLMINTDKHFYDLKIINQMKLTVNIQTFFLVLFILHIGSTVTGLGGSGEKLVRRESDDTALQIYGLNLKPWPSKILLGRGGYPKY